MSDEHKIKEGEDSKKVESPAEKTATTPEGEASKETAPDGAAAKGTNEKEKDPKEIIVKDAKEVKEKPKAKAPITPAEQSKVLKKADKKVADKVKAEDKLVKSIQKGAIFSKQFGVGTFPGNSVSAHMELVKEAAVQLLLDGEWEVESKVLDNGTTIQYIKK